MDLSFFGLKHPPFDNAPNPACFVGLPEHQAALETLTQAVHGRKGIVVVTGAPGTGKTLLGRMLRQQLGMQAAVSVVARPCGGGDDLWSALLEGFHVHARHGEAGCNPAQDFERFAEQLYQQDVPALVIVENAHDLPDACLDVLRQLACLEADDMPLVQIVLIGWPRLSARFLGLAGAAMQQRIYRTIRLSPLNEADTATYVRGRLLAAGGAADAVFTDEAIPVVFRRTGGIPRLINSLCEALLHEAARNGTRTVKAAMAESIAFDAAYDATVFEAQLADDEASVLFNARLREHPVIQEITQRLTETENRLTRCHEEIAVLHGQQPTIVRQLRRYDRICEQMLKTLRRAHAYRQDAEAVLQNCRQACEQVRQAVEQPGAMVEEARRFAREMQEFQTGATTFLAEVRQAQAAMREQIAAGGETARTLEEQRGATLPLMERTRQMADVLRSIHAATREQCERLEAFHEKTRALCDAFPGRLAQLEEATAQPVRILEELRLAERVLRRRIEAGQAQAGQVERIIEQAARAARNMREAVEQARHEDDRRRIAGAAVAAEQPDTGAGRSHATEAEDFGAGSLARRVQELRELVQTLRHNAAPATAR